MDASISRIVIGKGQKLAEVSGELAKWVAEFVPLDMYCRVG
jgi:hypothetical protein